MAKVSMRDIEWAVCQKFGVTHEILAGRSCLRAHSHPRQVLMFLARKMTSLSYPRIARSLNRDPRTAMHAVERVRYLVNCKPKIAAVIEELKNAITPVSLARETEEARIALALVEESDRRKAEKRRQQEATEIAAKLAALDARVEALTKARRAPGRADVKLQPICLHHGSSIKAPDKKRLMAGRA